jgi:hypothetical protein
MDDERRRELEQRLQYETDDALETFRRMRAGSAEERIATRILKERRQELRRSARIIAWATVVTAAATFAAALAAWTAIFFQYGHTAPNESHQSAASIAPTPSRLSTR